MRGVGYNAGAMRDAAKKGSVADKELLSELGEIGKAQAKDLSPVLAGAFGAGPGASITEAGMRVASELGVGKFKETKGVNARREFLTSQKVTMDAMLSGLNATYGGTRAAFQKGEGTAGQRLHELAPEVKRALAGELKANREALAQALEGKTAADLRAEISNTQEGLGKDLVELGIEKTYTATQRGRQVEREKTYGQLFAEARATKAARDKLAAQYNIDGKGKSLSQIQKETSEIQARRDAAIAEARRKAQEVYSDDSDDSSSDLARDIQETYEEEAYGGGFSGFAKGGLAQQMKQSGLASKK